MRHLHHAPALSPEETPIAVHVKAMWNAEHTGDISWQCLGGWLARSAQESDTKAPIQVLAASLF